MDLSTRELIQYDYEDAPSFAMNTISKVASGCPLSPTDLEVIINEGIFTFLLATTVVTFAIFLVLLLFAIYYFCFVFRKKKISFDWLRKRNTSRKISKTSNIIKANESMGYCEHCKGKCCRNTMQRQQTLLRRAPTLRASNNIIQHPTTGGTSSLSRIGSWRNVFYTPNTTNRINTYNQNDQYNY